MSLMEKPRDIVGGLVVMTIGAGFLMFGRELEMGTSFRMGPGYFPTILSIADDRAGRRHRCAGLRGHRFRKTASARCRGAGSP